jgi:hypothetical protein
MLSSSLALIARVMYHFFQEYGSPDISEVHIDTILVIIRYSTLCFDNRDFSKYLNRSLNMINTYAEYIKILQKKNDSEILIANDALQLILHRFPSVIRCDSSIENGKNDFHSEIAMRVFLDRIKEHKELYWNNDVKINSLAEEIYRTMSMV